MVASPLRPVLDDRSGRHVPAAHGSGLLASSGGRRQSSEVGASPSRAPKARPDAEARNITVAVRVRPLVERELKGGPGAAQPWALEPGGRSVREVRTGDTYCFDHVFSPEESTAHIFEVCARDVVRSACDGINGTIFAYGQTSSGKTFTMTGGDGEQGIIQRAVSELFDLISARTSGQQCTAYVVMVSYLEIYNEQVVDLLDPALSEVKVMEDTDRQLKLTPLRQPRARSAEEVLEILASGDEHRHVGQTKMNERSSRSHAILQLTLESSTGRDDGVRSSQLNLVDLAGSEGLRHTGSVGERRREGSNINRSLLALSQVINALSGDSRQARQHINFRDSKLTRILQPSLGGNAQTVVICAASPAACNVSETKSTLQFAMSAGRVQNRVKVNVSNGEQSVIRALQLEMESLRSELEARRSVGAMPEDSATEHLEAQLREQNVGLRSETERLEARMAELEAAVITSRSSLGKVRRRHTLSGRLSASPCKAISPWGTPVKAATSPIKAIGLSRSSSGTDLAVDYVVAAREARAAIARYETRRCSAEEAILKIESTKDDSELSTEEGSEESPGSSMGAGVSKADIEGPDAEERCPSESEPGPELDVLDELRPLAESFLSQLRALTGHGATPYGAIHEDMRVLHMLQQAAELADTLTESPRATRTESLPTTPLIVKANGPAFSPLRDTCLHGNAVSNTLFFQHDRADKPLPQPLDSGKVSHSDVPERLAYEMEQQLEVKSEITTLRDEMEQVHLHFNQEEPAPNGLDNSVATEALLAELETANNELARLQFLDSTQQANFDEDNEQADDKTVDNVRGLREELHSADSEFQLLDDELRKLEMDRAAFEKRQAADAEDLREKHLDLHCQHAKRDCASADLAQATSCFETAQHRRLTLQTELAVLRAQREQMTGVASIGALAAAMGTEDDARVEQVIAVPLDLQDGTAARAAVARTKEKVAEQKADCTRAQVECDRLKFELRRLRLENEDLEARIEESGQPEAKPQPQAEQSESLAALERRLKSEDARHERVVKELDAALRARERLREDVEDGRARAGQAVALAVEAAEARAAAERLEHRLASVRATPQKQRPPHEPLADVSNMSSRMARSASGKNIAVR